MIVNIPSIQVMVHEVESFIYKRSGVSVKIIFNDPFSTTRHLDMLKDLYKLIKIWEET